MFDWNEYIEFAKRLDDTECDECTCRIAISRLYYGILHLCLAFAQRNIVKSSEFTQLQRQHEIWDKFGSQAGTNKVYNQIAILGKKLRKLRNDCDYDSKTSIDKRNLTQSYKDIDRLLDLIKK